MIGKGIGKRLLAVGLCTALAAGMAGCGGKGKDTAQGTSQSGQSGINVQLESPDFVWVPAFHDLEGEINLYNAYLYDGSIYALYYDYDEQTKNGSESVVKYPVTENGVGEMERLCTPSTENGDRSINAFAVDKSSCIYTLEVAYPPMGEGGGVSGPDEAVESLPEEDMAEPEAAETDAEAAEASDEDGGADEDFAGAGDDAGYAAYGEEYWKSRTYWLCKYDAQGKLTWEVDITEPMNRDEENSWVQAMAADDTGRVCMACNRVLRFFNADGEMTGEDQTVSNGYISYLGRANNGKVYIVYSDYNASGNNVTLAEVDMAGAKLGTAYKDFPGYGNCGPVSVDDKTFLVSDAASAYYYYLDGGEKEKLFDWLDSDINGNYVQKMELLADGRIMALINDWESNTNSLVTLKETPYGEVAHKEIITVGSLYDDTRLKKAIVDFNKTSEKYTIKMKTYIDTQNWTENSYADAVTAMNNEIASGNCPDIISTGGLQNIPSLAKKGLFEDLGAYLDKSSVLSREDYYDNILDGMTYDGKLITIPYSFTLSTFVGRASDVGPDMGWTVQDFIALAKSRPDAEITDWAVRESMMQYLFQLNIDDFIDFEKGECRFDSQEFKDVLEYVATLPSYETYQSSGRPTPAMISEGKILLDTLYISDFRGLQIAYAEFGDDPITFIGFPNGQGKSGCLMMPSETYALSSKSQNKEAAWEFLETILSRDPSTDRFFGGFPTRKSAYEEMKAKEMEVKYVIDPDTGEPLLDDKGEPIVEDDGAYSIGYGSESGEEWNYDYHPVTQQELQTLEMLIQASTYANWSIDEQIMNIINEEADYFYNGQKSVDEVANIIQSRISLYVKENS